MATKTAPSNPRVFLLAAKWTPKMSRRSRRTLSYFAM